MKILVAHDNSPYAEEALADLHRAGLPNDAETIVLCVADTWELPETTGIISNREGKFIHPTTVSVQRHLENVTDRMQSRADKIAMRLKNEFSGWSIEGVGRTGKPAWEIIKMSDKWAADLVVVGSHGRGAVGRALLGSVSQKTLNESKCSVRIARKRANESNEPLRLLVAVDGSRNAEAVIETVAGRNWTKGTKVRLVAVNDPFKHSKAGYMPWDLNADAPQDTEANKVWISKVIDSPAEMLRGRGLSVSKIIRWGDAGNMIISEAEEWKADSIFMGARGLGRFDRFWLGSVSSSVAARYSSSVEVVRMRGSE